MLGVRVYAENTMEYEILVDVEDSKLWLFHNGKVEKEYVCAGGKTSTPSPIGTWKITSKANGERGLVEDGWGLTFLGGILAFTEPHRHIR